MKLLPAIIIFCASGLSAQTRIAVLPFDNRSDQASEWLRYGLSSLLSDALTATGKMFCVGLDDLHKAATENDIRSRSLFDGTVTPSFAKQALEWKLTYAIVGRFGVIQDSLWMQMRIVDISKRAFGPAITAGGRLTPYTDFFVTMLHVQENLFSDLILQTTIDLQRDDLVKMNDKTRASIADLEGFKSYVKSWLALKQFDAGLKAVEQKQYDAAIGYFESASRLDEPRTLRAADNLAKSYILRANAWSAKGLLDSAIADLTAALAVDSNQVEAYFNLGNAYRSKGESDRALSLYLKTFQLNPAHFEAQMNIGYVLLDQGKNSEAVSAYGSAKKTQPQNATASFYLGVAYDKIGDVAKAKSEYVEAIRLDSTLAGAPLNLGIILSNSGDIAGARRHYNTALTYSPTDAAAHRNLGILLMNDKKEAKQAIYHLEKTLDLDPKQSEADMIRKNITILTKRMKKK